MAKLKSRVIYYQSISNQFSVKKMPNNFLRKYKCPFREAGYCKYNDQPFKCKFGHPMPRNSYERLRNIPEFICVYYLVNSCLYKCHSLHVSLDDLKQWNIKKYNYAPQIKKIESQKDMNIECGICFEKVKRRLVPKYRKFGILENCSHIFCMNCLTEWRKHSNRCPMCREVSKYYIFHHTIVDDEFQKKQLFKSPKVICEVSKIDWSDIEYINPIDYNGQSIFLELDSDTDF